MIATYTLDEIQAQVQAFFAARFPGRDLGTESWLGKQARATAMALLLVQKAIGDADADGSPTDRTSTAALDSFAFIFGLPNGSGGYGRRSAVAASGGIGTITGTNGTLFADGLIALASDGVTQLRLSGAVTIPGVPPGSGTIPGAFVAVTTGIAGNLIAGSVLTWQSPPAGAAASVVLTSGLTGGLDSETDAALLARLYDRLQRPPRGGAAVDYRLWAEAASTAVRRAYVYPLRLGTGTVQTALTAGGSGTGRILSISAPVVAAVDAYVNGVRPVTVEGYASIVPAMPGASGMEIRARVVPALDRYAFDWDDTGPVIYTVSAWAPGPPAMLTLALVAPASLKSQIDLGLRPRLQVLIAGGPPVPVQVRATAWLDIGFTTRLTLENPLPTGFLGGAAAPSIGDQVFAGGPIPTLIAQALLDYVDGLGPSRADGYADPEDAWTDTASIARMIQIALDVTDTDGVTRLASTLVLPTSLTIDGSAVDRQALADIGGVPELLWAAHVAVTQ